MIICPIFLSMQIHFHQARGYITHNSSLQEVEGGCWGQDKREPEGRHHEVCRLQPHGPAAPADCGAIWDREDVHAGPVCETRPPGA